MSFPNTILSKSVLFFKTKPALQIAFFCAGVIGVSSGVIFLIETDSVFTSLFDAIWWSIVTISTVGYGDYVPTSFIGRLCAIITIFLGMAIMGTITGKIASFLMERQMKEEKGLVDLNAMRGHLIICGWKREMGHVLKEILTANREFGISQVVLLNNAPLEEVNNVRSDPRLNGIRYVHGDFIEEKDLIRAGAGHAAKILVLADYYTAGDLQQIDSKTVMAIMSIKNVNQSVYTCAELLDTKFEKYLKIVHCDEVLLSRDFSRAMIASASSGDGLSHVIQQLLSSESGTRLKTVPVPKKFIGGPYSAYAAHIHKTLPHILLGILANTGRVTERKKEALSQVQKSTDISTLLPNLRKVKHIIANQPLINPPPDYTIETHDKGIIIEGTSAR